MKTSTFYDGVVGDTYCKITSKIWSFGSHHIPFHAISDVYAARISNIKAAIGYCVAAAILGVVFWGLATDWIFYGEVEAIAILLSILLIIIIIFANQKKVVITIISKGLKHVYINSGNKDIDKAVNLYEAMLKCLNEGEVYNVRLGFGNLSNDDSHSTQVSGTIEKESNHIECPDCGAAIPSDAKECPNCGCPESFFNKEYKE